VDSFSLVLTELIPVVTNRFGFGLNETIVPVSDFVKRMSDNGWGGAHDLGRSNGCCTGLSRCSQLEFEVELKQKAYFFFLAAFFLVVFLAAFFLVDFLAAFFLAGAFFLAVFFLAAFFLVDFLAAFFLVVFFAAFFLVDFLAAFFLAAFFLAVFFLAAFFLVAISNGSLLWATGSFVSLFPDAQAGKKQMACEPPLA